MKRLSLTSALVALTATAAAADTFTMQSAFPALPVLHPTAERFVGMVDIRDWLTKHEA